jgi:drug/metabolite transporter (DMT)-like permease
VTPNKTTGLVLALAGFALLSVGDSIAKSMAGEWPGTAIGALRYGFGTVGLFVILWLREGRAGFRMPSPLLHIGRGATVAIGSACFFVGLHFMPLAEATVITFTNPLLTAIFSALFLREAAPKAAWVATALAFIGVVIVLRPSVAHLGVGALLPLVTATLMAVMMIFNRMAAGSAGLILMQFLMSVAAVPMLLGLTVAGHFSGIAALAVTMPTPIVIAKCMIMAVTATTAHALIYAATERASAALIAPMTYVQLIAAVLIGWIVFGDIPDLATYAGAVLIIGGGIYLWNSQRAR